MVVVMLDVEVDVSLGGGGGDATPGDDIVPPNAETASAMLKIATAHVWRKVFTWVPPKKMQNFCISEDNAKLLRRTLNHSNFSCKSVRECVRFVRGTALNLVLT